MRKEQLRALRRAGPRMMWTGVFGIVAGFTGAAMAQDGDSKKSVDEIVVTGSRIQQTNLVTNSPVTQVGSDEISLQGTVRVEDMLRTLPQIYQNQGTGQSNGATGTATLNLRNLGDERTLVLVNGRRLPAGSPIQGGIGADINQIPAALIDRVEVLTGGASATYGSDAVAGVVNFIMRDDFEGVQLDTQYSVYQHGNDDGGIQQIVTDAGYDVASSTETNGDTKDFSIIMGGNLDGGKGNVTGYLTYRDIKPVTQAVRDYSSCALNNDATGCVGSSTIPQGRFLGIGNDEFDFMVQGDQFVDRMGTTFNFGPFNYFQRPDERWTGGMFAHYDVTDKIESYMSAMIMDDRTVSQIAPSGNFGHTTTLSCGNPLLSDQQFEAMCGQFGLTRDDVQDVLNLRRNVEGGNRQQDLRHTSIRSVFGFRGELSSVWSFDVSGQFSEVSMENTYLNDLSIARIQRALDAVEDPATGEVVCSSVLNGTDPNCVPWNIFSEGGVTQEALDYLTLPLFARGTTDQTVLTGYVSADLGNYGFKMPGSSAGVAVVLGVEKRDEALDFNPDFGFRSGDGSGQGGATGAVSGGYDVTEFFLESNVPLVEDAPFAQQLGLDIGYRYSDYSTGVTTSTYGLRAGWTVNPTVKSRVSFQKAVRAANVQELFLPQGFNLFDIDPDPCGGPVTNGMTEAGRTFEECARSGVTAEQFGNIQNNPAGQYNFLQGGNPNLEPEEADTFSVGIILTPEMIAGLTVSLDYYDIEITEGISNIAPDFILEQCLDGNLDQCQFVNRNATRGDLWIGSDINSSGHVVALQNNLAIESVQGFDLVVDYKMDLGRNGTLNFNNVLGLITTWDQQEIAAAPVVDCKGNWNASCGFPTPDLQNNLRATWNTPWNVRASALWRHISEVKDIEGRVDLGAVNYFDLAGVYEFSEKLSARVGINNVLDEAPPIAGGRAGPSVQGNGNIFPGMYDALGRYMFVGLSVKL